MKKTVLTGIKPTGDAHIGNYLGAIKPALQLAHDYNAYYFIADYHALNTIKDPKLLRSYTLDISACWLACGLNPEKTTFFKQSDIPEVLELFAILTCFTNKSRLNGAHAYKSIVDDNILNQRDPESKINVGLYTYPVLMASDILLYQSDLVPVGKDQIQHIEIAIDIAQMVNRTYKKSIFNLPQIMLEEKTQVIIGTDGQKMSKSYKNTIPLFTGNKKLRKSIMGITTNSQSIEEPKDPNKCNIFSIYKLIAQEEEVKKLHQRYTQGGLSWGEAKEELYKVMDRFIAPIRSRYEDIRSDESKIEKILLDGASKARKTASNNLLEIKKRIGISTVS